MPIYEYECQACGLRFEKLQKISDRKVRTCPECKGKVERLVSAPAIQFKGTGWYVTDYSDKGKEARKAEKAESGASDKKESKSETKSDKKDGAAKDTAKKDAKKDSGTKAAKKRD